MRFLCLHGRGTNSDILESQIHQIISKSSSQHSYEFVDGSFECEPAFGVDSLFSGPYLCYYDHHDTSSIRSALEELEEIIEEDGPFDGVIGFSQGAALVSSLLLCHQLEKPKKKLPFKVALFIAGGLPLSPSSTIGKNSTKEAQRAQKAANILLFDEADVEKEAGIQITEQEVTSESENEDAGEEIYTFDPDFFREALIPIPTVHVIGTNDPWQYYSRDLVKLCKADNAKIHFHAGGHEVPRKEASIRAVRQMFESAIEMATRL